MKQKITNPAIGRMADDRRRVHSSLYKSLRTNLPRHIMAYSDFPFDSHLSGSSDDSLYCGHQELSHFSHTHRLAVAANAMEGLYLSVDQLVNPTIL